MLSRVSRRALDAVIGVFALLGFVAVPLGDRTGYQHLRAIVATPEAERFGRELFDAGLRVRAQLLGTPSAAVAPDPAPLLPAGSVRRPHGPKAQPPQLSHMVPAARDAGLDASVTNPGS